MNVRLPDGTLLTGVPDDMSKADLDAKLARNGYDMSKLGPAPAPAPQAPAPAPEPDSFWSRFGTGVADPFVGLGQIADKTGVPGAIRSGLSHVLPDIFVPGSDTSMEDVVRQRDADYHAPEGFDAARLAGNVASPINFIGAGTGRLVSGAASKVPLAGPAIAKVLASGPQVGAGTMGFVQGVAQPTAADDDNVTFAAKKLGQGALGATIGRFVGGAPKTPEAEALARQNVNVTRAQGAGGAANNIEEKLTSLPYAGSVIDKARRKGASEFQDAVLAREAGVALPRGATVDDANKVLSDLYEQAVPYLKPTVEGWDNAMLALDKAKQNPLLTAENQKALDGIVNKYFGNYTELSGRELQTLQSELAHIGRSYSGATASPSEKIMAEEVYNVLGGLRDGLTSGMPAEMAAKFAQANAGWRKMQAVNKAASTRIDEAVMPRALQKAMARQARTDTSRLPADSLIDPALRVIEKVTSDSGTAGRTAAQGLWPSAKGLALAPVAAGYYGAEALLRKLPKSGPITRDALARALVAAERGENYNPNEE